jgi:DNA-binding CsgD family transcriptional regulator/tetratricopeptide (TPR) repeat protein
VAESSLPLRGRDVELGRVVGVLRRAKESGRGAVVLVSGDAGIGKSAVLAAVAARAPELGFAVGTGKAEDNGRIAPMAPLLLALRSGPAPLLSGATFGDLAPLYDRHLWFVDSLADALAERAGETPVLVVVDDLHWADELTLFALRILPGRLAHRPVVWLLAGRPNPENTIMRVTESAPRDLPVETVALGPLAASAIEQLAVDRLGDTAGASVHIMLAGAGGSPFLAVRLLDGLAAESSGAPSPGGSLPAELVNGVRAALAPLPPAALRFARVGAVLGRSFTLDDAAALTGEPGALSVLSCLEPLIRGGFLTDDGRELAFVHDLVRQAVYEDVPPSVRKVMHRTAAERLLTAGDRRFEAAPHVLISAEPGDTRAIAVLRGAANDLAAPLPAMAVQLIQRAFGLLTPADDGWLPLGERAMAITAKGQYAEQAMKLADVLLAHTADTLAVVRIQLRLSRPLWNMGLLRELRERAEQLLTNEGLSVAQRALLGAQLALALSRVDPPAARKAAEATLADGERLAHNGIRMTALWALGEVSRNEGRFTESLEHYEQMRTLSRWPYSINEMLTLQLLDRPDDSGRMITAAEADLHDRGSTAELYAVRFAQLWQRYLLGELDGAEESALTFLQLCEELPECAFITEARLVLSRIAYLRDDLPALREQLTKAETGPSGDDGTHTALVRIIRFWVAVASDDPAGALDTIRAILDDVATQLHRCRWEPAWPVEAVRVALAGGAPELAEEVTASVRQLATDNPGVPTAVGLVRHLDGLLGDDADTLAEAVTKLRSGPRPLVLAEALADYGRKRPAEAALTEAAQLFAAAGVRTNPAPARPTVGWAALTPAEHRVAELVATGNSNRTVASELFVSPNTVATHLRSVFSKLEINSRVQLAHAFLTKP